MTTRSAVLGLTAVNILWGLSFPLMRLANLRMGAEHGYSQEQLEKPENAWFTFQAAMFLITLRFGAAFVLLAAAAPSLFRRPKWSEWAPGFAIGSAFFFGLVLQNAGLSSIPASRSGFLTSLAIVFTPLLTTVLLRRLPNGTIIASVILALIGTAILTKQLSFGASDPSKSSALAVGDVLTVVSAVVFAVQIITLDRFGKGRDSARFTPAMFAAATTLGAICFSLTLGWKSESNDRWLTLLGDGPFLAVILALVIFCSILAFVGMNRFQPWMSAEQAAVVYTLEPIFATLWAVAVPPYLAPMLGVEYPGEVLAVEFWIGAALILAATFFCLKPDKSPPGPS